MKYAKSKDGHFYSVIQFNRCHFYFFEYSVYIEPTLQRSGLPSNGFVYRLRILLPILLIASLLMLQS